MAVKTLNVNEDILSANDLLADNLKTRFEAAGVFVMNLMSSPGAGKTSLILRIIESLAPKHKIGVIEGDIASDVDARKIGLRTWTWSRSIPVEPATWTQT